MFGSIVNKVSSPPSATIEKVPPGSDSTDVVALVNKDEEILISSDSTA